CGTGAGIVLWLLSGGPLTRTLRRYTGSNARSRSQLDLVLRVYLFGFFVYSMLPLDLATHPDELYRKLEEGRIAIGPRLSGNLLWEVLSHVLDLLLYIPVGALAARISGGRGASSLLGGVWLGAVFAVFIEVCQIVVMSRFASVTDVLAGVAGVSIGACLVGRWAAPEPAPVGRAAQGPFLSLARGLSVGLLYAIVLCGVFWWPLEIRRDEAAAWQALQGFFRVPFAALYQGPEFNAATEILRKLLLFGPLGMLLTHLVLSRSRSGPARSALLLGGILLCGAWGVGIEVAQAVFPPHVPDITDVILYTAGAGLGVAVLWRIRQASVG
ncbi:MAG: VanZ family protein, partial [Planctomycetaceae bacterium]